VYVRITPLLQNAVIDALVSRLALDDAVPYDIIAYLETHALGSKLNKLVLHIVKHCGEKADVKKWSHSFSPDSIGTVKERMGKSVIVKEYLEGAMVCGKYHIHLEADERDGEGFGSIRL
jgi:chlorite dismutase